MIRSRVSLAFVATVLLIGAYAYSQTGQGSSSSSTYKSGASQGSATSSSSASGSATSRGQGSGVASASMLMAKPTHAIIHSPSDTWNSTPKSERDRIAKDQAAYYTALASRGKVLFSGPWKKEPGMLTILTVKTDDEAQEIVEDDPAVLNGIYDARVRGWNVVVMPSASKVGAGGER